MKATVTKIRIKPGQLDPAVNDRFLLYFSYLIGAVLRLVTVVNGLKIEHPTVYPHLQYDETRP